MLSPILSSESQRLASRNFRIEGMGLSIELFPLLVIWPWFSQFFSSTIDFHFSLTQASLSLGHFFGDSTFPEGISKSFLFVFRSS